MFGRFKMGLEPVMGRAGAVAAFAGAYDNISSIVHHYEMARRGFTSYTGALVRLRRDSDDAESDFTYDSNGDLDTAAITTWLGGANGFIVTLYDQVGTDNVTQATAANQPAYVASGQNSKPVMRFNGTSHRLQGAFTNGGILSQPYNIYVAASLDVAAVNDDNFRILVDGDDGTNSNFLYQYKTSTPDAFAIFAGSVVVGSDSNSTFNIWTALFNNTSSQFWLNGSSQATGTAGTKNVDGLTIGSASGGTLLWDGDVAMVSIADPNNDRAAMETAINAYYAAF